MSDKTKTEYVPNIVDELYKRILANHNSKAYVVGKTCYFPVSVEYVRLLAHDEKVPIDLKQKEQYTLFGYIPEPIENGWRFVYDVVRKK